MFSVSQRHSWEVRGEGEVAGIIMTAPEGGIGGKPDDDDENNLISSATLDECRKVYGHNVLPHWALKDKVLVSGFKKLHICREFMVLCRFCC